VKPTVVVINSDEEIGSNDTTMEALEQDDDFIPEVSAPSLSCPTSLEK
jgi:hypothetical protein